MTGRVCGGGGCAPRDKFSGSNVGSLEDHVVVDDGGQNSLEFGWMGRG